MGICACFRVWYPNGLVLFTIVVSVCVQIFGLVGTLTTSRVRSQPPPQSTPPHPSNAHIKIRCLSTQLLCDASQWIFPHSLSMFTHIYPPQCQQHNDQHRNSELKTSGLQQCLRRGCFVGCAIWQLPTQIAIYRMVGRAFVVAKKGFHHRNGNIYHPR